MFLGPCTFTKDFKLTVQSVHLIKDILLILKYFWNCGHFLILICCNKYFSKWQNGDNYLNKFHFGIYTRILFKNCARPYKISGGMGAQFSGTRNQLKNGLLKASRTRLFFISCHILWFTYPSSAALRCGPLWKIIK